MKHKLYILNKCCDVAVGWQNSLVQGKLALLTQAPKTCFFLTLRTSGTSVASGLGGNEFERNPSAKPGCPRKREGGACRETYPTKWH